MTWLWIAMVALVVCLGIGLFYWHLIIAEGAYLGARVVAWTYDWVARRYDSIKQFDPRDDDWFLAHPLLRELQELQELSAAEHPLILDVATGTGRLPLALLRRGYRGSIIGLDLSPGMLGQARAKLRPYGGQVGLIRQDASRLPFGDAAFDAVTCLEALEFFPRPREALAEMVRVLAPSGVLFVSNRVGREAWLLPGKAIPQARLEATLAGYSMHDVQVQRWQVSYDLAMARKDGHKVRG